ncbi:putative ribonuclease H-like domain-containing protein, partial [Tanacetum coccineum]
MDQLGCPQEANHNASTKDNIDAGDFKKEDESAQDYFILPILSSYSSTVKRSTAKDAAQEKDANDAAEALRKEFAQETENLLLQAGAAKASSTNIVNTVNTPVSTASPYGGLSLSSDLTNPDVSPSYHTLKGITSIHLHFNSGNHNQQFKQELKIEAIRIFLAFCLLRGIHSLSNGCEKCLQPPGFKDPKYPQKALFIKKDKHDILLVQVYVDDMIFGSTKKSWCDEFEALMKNRFQMSSMGELTFFLRLQVKQKADGIFISQDKYVIEILKKFNFVNVKTASTPIQTQKPLVKDEEASDVDVHIYRSMIGSLMYLTASRPDIMFAVCACSRFQVTPKSSHLSDVKRIFRYLKGKPKVGLWYPRVSSFDLEAYSDSDYAGANLDRKSTTGEAEYVAAASCCRQVFWIQNQMLDYGFNFMNIKIHIDNESTICLVKNPVYHSKTKHIAIRHHFIRDAYEKKLIQVLKIHTDDNVADLLTKAFDVSSIQCVEAFLTISDGIEGLLLPKLFILWLAK